MGESPEFSARARGILSKASAKDRKAYCSKVEICMEIILGKGSRQKYMVYNNDLVVYMQAKGTG